MAPITVRVKNAGKVHDVQLDPDQPATIFKDAVYQVTGVPPDRMKVMIKGGVLKDDTDWRKVGPKEGQTFMVIGAAGELPKPPPKPTVFLEDMDEEDLANVLALPVGLRNVGNTCYMNATVQAMRAIPELQAALATSGNSGLPLALGDLYRTMARTTDPVTPGTFLAELRTAFPQFAEVNRSSSKGFGAQYAQQDAEECWSQMIHALKGVRGITSGPSSGSIKFVDQYMTGTMQRELKCDEAPEEPPTVTTENVLKLECNISITTNYMHTGIMDALDGKIEKRSPSLGREAIYTSHSRLTRLPSYLTVHMVRFAWRRDINKKAKIMRKVRFPTDFDAIDLVTEEVKQKLLPVNRKLQLVEKERLDRRRLRKRTKNITNPDLTATTETPPVQNGEAPMEDVQAPVPELELEDEAVIREREKKELEELIPPDLKADVGCSVSGLYELVAIVTHKGAAADAGHYMAYVKKSVFRQKPSFEGSIASSSGLGAQIDEDDEDWYKFDDDKVSIFPKEKLNTLDGGGEDSAAYVLLYKTKDLA